MTNIQFYAATHMEYMKFLLGHPLFESPVELLQKVKDYSHGIKSDLLERIDPISFDNKSYCYAIGDVRIFEVPVSQSQTIYQIVSRVTGPLAFANVQQLFKPGVNSASLNELLSSGKGLPVHPFLSQELVRVFGSNLENLPDNTKMVSSVTDFSVIRHYEDQAGALLDLLITALNELHMNTVYVFAPEARNQDQFHPFGFDSPEDVPSGWNEIRVEIFDTVQMANAFRLNTSFSSMRTMIQLGNTFFFNMPFFSHFTGESH